MKNISDGTAAIEQISSFVSRNKTQEYLRIEILVIIKVQIYIYTQKIILVAWIDISMVTDIDV